jgi:flagellar motor protein MotB
MVRASRETQSARESAQVNEEQAKELQTLKGENKQVIADLAKLAEELDPKLGGLGSLDESHVDSQDPFVLTLVLKRGSVKFAPGECALDPAADDALAALSRSVLPLVCKAVAAKVVRTISLEGHTDNRGYFLDTPRCGVEPSSGCTPESRDEKCVAQGFENNVQLSAARAQHVFFHIDRLLSADASGDALALRQCLEDHFAIAGRGPVEPLSSHSWHALQDDAERNANRRVVIKLRALARSGLDKR